MLTFSPWWMIHCSSLRFHPFLPSNLMTIPKPSSSSRLPQPPLPPQPVRRTHWLCCPKTTRSLLVCCPFAVPELISHIGCFLDFRSLECCLLVCRAWYHALLPLRWHSISLRYTTDWGYGVRNDVNIFGPDLQSLYIHAHFILSLKITANDFQDLTILLHRIRPVATGNPDDKDPPNCGRQRPGQSQEDHTLKIFELTYPNLSVLDLDQEDDDGAFVNNPSLVPFLWRHQSTVKSLTISCFTDGQNNKLGVLESLEKFPRLERLKLGHWPMGSLQGWIDQYESLWSRLQILIVHELWTNLPYGPFPRSQEEAALTWLRDCATQSNLHTLEMCTPGAGDSLRTQLQLLLILKSPQLTRLVWENCRALDPVERPMALLAAAIRSGQFSKGQQEQLVSLSLGASDFQLLDFECLLTSLSRLKELDLHKSSFDRLSWRAMWDQGPLFRRTLTVLNLGKCLQMDGALVHEILCEMPSLEMFEAGHVMEANLRQDPRPWACEGLRDLSVAMVDTKSRNGIEKEDQSGAHSRLVSQLLKLNRLEVLDLRNRRLYQDVEIIPIQLTLEEGGYLDQLKSLRWMKCLRAPMLVLDPRQIRWKAREARWAMQHWIRLEQLMFVALDDDEAMAILKDPYESGLQ